MENREGGNIWNRVLGLPNPEKLLALMTWEAEVEGDFRELCRRGRPGEEPMHRARAHYHRLGGIYRMLTGCEPGAPGTAGGNLETPGFWHRCYGRCLRLARGYGELEQWPDYGPVFARLAREQWEQAGALLEMLGREEP